MSDEREATWYRWDELPREVLHERLARRLITGDRVMLAHVYLKKGCVVPRHAHENEQFTYILEGALEFLVGEDGAREIVVRATRSTWTCSRHRARTGSTRRTRTCGASPHPLSPSPYRERGDDRRRESPLSRRERGSKG